MVFVKEIVGVVICYEKRKSKLKNIFAISEKCKTAQKCIVIAYSGEQCCTNILYNIVTW